MRWRTEADSILNGWRILTQSAAAVGARKVPRRLLAAALLMGFGIVAAFALAPDSSLPDVATHLIQRDLAAPVITELVRTDEYWREERIARGDTLGSVLARLSISDATALQFLHNDPAARTLYQLKPGKSLRVQTDDDGHLLALSYLTQNGDVLTVHRGANGFIAESAAAAAHCPPGNACGRDTLVAVRGGRRRRAS